MASSPSDLSDRQWFIAERWQQYAAEHRVNMLRIVAIGSFYVIHLLNHYQVRLGLLQLGDGAGGDARFHASVTALAVAWTMVALGILLCLSQQIFPGWLKYFSTACDVVFLTSILYVAGGPRSPMVVGYFLILIAAALRFSLPLVRATTLGCILGYVCLLGCAKWPETFGGGGADLRVPRYQQLIMLLALALAGVLLGQMVRRVRSLARDFGERLHVVQEEAP